MDNARKKYVNIDRLSSGDILALLDSNESDDEGDIENIMNDSDTEFVAGDESEISTNTIRKEDIGDQSSSVSVPEESTHILPTLKEDESNTLGQYEPNYVPTTQRTSNQSPSPANQRTSNQSPSPANLRTANQSPSAATQLTSNQSPAAAAQCTANESPNAVVTRRTSDQSSKSTPPPTVTLPQKNKKWKQSSMIKDKTKKNKRSMLYPTRITQTRKRAVSHRGRQNKEEKNQYDQEMGMGG